MEYEEVIVDDLSKEVSFNTGDCSSIFGTGNFCLKDNCSMVYLHNGTPHRDDGPALIETSFVPKCQAYYFTYYKHGELHNELGPAYSLFHSSKLEPIEELYYLNNMKYSKEEWEKQIQTKLYW